MTTRTLCVADSQTGQRLDRFLADQTADLSRSQLQRLIREGRVRVDGIDAKPSLRLETGQHVILDIPPPAQLALIPQPMALSIVYDDRDIVVVDKPAGMVVHPGHGVSSGTLVNALIARFPEMCSFEDSLRPGIVHRLDKGTSGLIVVAKNPAALLHLQRQFATRTVSKSYWTLVHGALSVERGLIEAPIGRNRGRPTQMAIAGRAERPARTAFTVLERYPRFTLVEAQPITGRTHQIRLHFAGLGHAIVGDQVYGRGETLGLTRQFLHAKRLRLTLPATGLPHEFESMLPDDLLDVLARLREQTHERIPETE